MSTFKFLVEVDAEDKEQAERVMSERLNPDEDYGFDYGIKWKGVNVPPGLIATALTIVKKGDN